MEKKDHNTIQQQVSRYMSMLGEDANYVERQLEELKKKCPDHLDTYFALGFVYSRFLNFEKSNCVMREALAINPNLAHAHFNLAYNFWQMNQVEQSDADFEKALVLSNKKDPLLYLVYSIFLYQQGDQKKSAKLLSEIEHLFPTDVRLAFLRLQHAKETADLSVIHQLLRSLHANIQSNTAVMHDLFRFICLYDFPKWRYLDDKNSLREVVNQFYLQCPAEPCYFPKTFSLVDEKEAYLAARKEHPFWACKPMTSSSGQGIFIVNNQHAVTSEQSLLMQQYIHNPLLLNGYKFNIRAYLVFTSINPLRAYLWNDGVVFVSPELFSVSEAGLKKLEAHIANPLLSMKHPKLYIANSLEEDYKSHIRRLSTLLSQAKEFEFDAAAMRESLFLLASQVTRLIDRMLLKKEHFPEDISFSYPLKIIGLDIVFDEATQPYCVEIERSPGLSAPAKDVISNKIKHNLLTDAGGLACPADCQLDQQHFKQQLETAEYLAAKNFTPLCPSQSEWEARVQKQA